MFKGNSLHVLWHILGVSFCTFSNYVSINITYSLYYRLGKDSIFWSEYKLFSNFTRLIRLYFQKINIFALQEKNLNK